MYQTKLLFFLIFSISFLNAQNLSNNLKGTYTTKNKSAMYSSFHFDGNGKVKVNDYEDEYIFYEKNDSIFILVDKSPFVMVKNSKGVLKGITHWIENENFKSSTKNFEYAPSNSNHQRYLQLLDQYYVLNFDKGFDLILEAQPDHRMATIEEIQLGNKKICDQDFELACVQEFAYRLTNMLGGLESYLNGTPVEVKDDKGLLDLGKKIIRLGNPDGYGLIASYYMALGDEEQSNNYLNQGLENGCKICLEMEMNKMLQGLEAEVEN